MCYVVIFTAVSRNRLAVYSRPSLSLLESTWAPLLEGKKKSSLAFLSRVQRSHANTNSHAISRWTLTPAVWSEEGLWIQVCFAGRWRPAHGPGPISGPGRSPRSRFHRPDPDFWTH
jgi:hypothetical protein